jgi:IS5 family transposase
MPGNPYDGHTLYEMLEQAEILSGVKAREVFVDRGYRGEQARGLDVKVWISGARRGVSRRLKADIRRRSAIEPIIGHMKNDGLLRRTGSRAAWAMRCTRCGAQFTDDPEEAAASFCPNPGGLPASVCPMFGGK